MALLAKVKAIKIRKAMKAPAVKKINSASVSKAISSALKSGNKKILTAETKSIKVNIKAGNTAQAFIKKLKKNKGLVK